MKRSTLVLLLLLVATQTWAAFGYYTTVSINAAQVPSTQTNFPVLVSVTDARFKTVANGGHVQNASGYDIRPYTDTTLSTAITGYELERYNASTGEVVMWVKVSSLTSSSTPFVLAYGDTSISTDGSSTTTWSNSFISVYHLKDGTTLSVADAVGTNNGTNHSATATAGQIDGACNVASASSQYISSNAGGTVNVGFTLSVWVNGTSFPNGYNGVITMVDGTNTQSRFLEVKSTGKLVCYVTNSPDVFYDGTGVTTLSTGTSYYLTMVYSSAVGLIGYVNASVDKSVSSSQGTPAVATTDIGQDIKTAGRFFNGMIDEARISSVVRSADWITTEYNNQSAPSTFETLGTEFTIVPPKGNFFYSD